MTPAAIMGDYTDLAFRKTRKVAVISIEIPIEKAAEFVAAFGTPSQVTGTPVAIARIDPSASEKPVSEPAKRVEEPSERDRRKWREMAPAAQAALRCKEPAFQRFMFEVRNWSADENGATDGVRATCRVKSRADILDGTRAADLWHALNDEYLAWRAVG